MTDPRRTQPQMVAIFAGTGVMLWLCWGMLRPFLQSIVWAAVLAVLFFPAHRWLHRRLKSPTLAAAASIVLVLITVIGPLAFVTAAMLQELAGLANSVQEATQQLQADPGTARSLVQLRQAAGRFVDVDKLLAPESVRQIATVASQFLVEKSATLIGNVLGALVSAALTLFTLFYLFRDGEAIARRIPDILPLEREDALRIVARTREMITASVYGVVVIAIIQGTLGGIMFAILGLPSPFVWGVVMTILSTVPMVGSALVWAPAAGWLFVTSHYGRGITLLVWCIVVIGTVDNLLRPRLVGRRTQMHELFIFFSVIGGLGLFGMVGLLLGPVVLAITFALLEVLFGARTDGAAQDPAT